MIEVRKNLGLRRILLRPLPLLLQRLMPAIAVFHAGCVAPGSRIAVPVPGATDPVACLDHLGLEPQGSSLVQHVQPGKPGPNNHHVELTRHGHRIAGAASHGHSGI